jgi:hypothetical protein
MLDIQLQDNIGFSSMYLRLRLKRERARTIAVQYACWQSTCSRLGQDRTVQLYAGPWPTTAQRSTHMGGESLKGDPHDTGR